MKMWESCSIVFVVAVFGSIDWIPRANGQYYQSQYVHHCYMLSCLGCGAHASSRRGDSVECHPSNWVSALWLHNIAHPPPTTSSVFPVEYRCIKMVATPDDTTRGRTVDVIRGCVPTVQVDSVCTTLVAVERSRGHGDARCFVCRGDNCNSARATTQDKMAAAIVMAVALISFR